MYSTRRSYRKELLDEDHIPVADLYRNLYELDVINRLLGGHAVTIKGLSQLNLQKGRTYHILDIGSGGGDTLKAVASWGRKNGYTFRLTGVDLKADCISYATGFCKEYPEIRFVQSDYRHLPAMGEQYDIIITSLFCHHLDDAALRFLFGWCISNARIGFVMNDLHRHPLAYYSIAMLTGLLSKSYLVRNDAKLSVQRGFSRSELAEALPAGFTNYSLSWSWAFRWLLVIPKQA
jgi:2-polyprenyl-3-methyl-5-hydroxy-6-metoxy-1,4-benzoquinol methylase